MRLFHSRTDSTKSPRPRANARRRRLFMEPLESRLPLAVAEMVDDSAVENNGLRPGFENSYLDFFTNLSGTLYFSANSGSGAELWRINNSTGLAEVVDIGLFGSNPAYLTNVGGTLYFRASDNDTIGNELWRINNNTGNAELVSDINPGNYPAGGPARGSNPRFLTNVNGTLFFVATNTAFGEELWRINAAGNAELVTDIHTGVNYAGNANSSTPQFLTAAGGTLYFTAFDGADAGEHGQELWRANPTGAASLVEDVVAGTGSSSPNNLFNLNGRLFFSADNTVGATGNGRELWRVNVLGNAQLVTDINTSVDNYGNPQGSSPDQFAASSGFLFFRAFDGTTAGKHGTELWRAGPTGGATLAADINPGTTGGNPTNLKDLNGTLFFNAEDGTNGNEVWRVTGTGTATMVEDSVAGGGIGNGNNNYGVCCRNADASLFTPIGNTMYFSANDGIHGAELFRAGATGNAELVADIFTQANAGSNPNILTNVDGTLYFAANDNVNGFELWRVNNSSGQAELVFDPRISFCSGYPASGQPSKMTSVNGTVYFKASDGFSNGNCPGDGTNGYELWRLTSVTQRDKVGVHRSNQFFQDVNGNFAFNGVGGGDRLFTFGNPGDVAIRGDWDGDGDDEIGAHRNNQFYMDVNGNGVWNGAAGGDVLFSFGNAGDVPIIGDWDGDGDDQIGVHRGNQFFLDVNGNGAFNGGGGGDTLFAFGNAGDVPVIGDWDGDGDDQIGVYRGNQFFLDKNGNGVFNGGVGNDLAFTFGSVGDKPLAGDWDGDGDDQIGVHRGSEFFLDRNGNGVSDGPAGGDRLFNFGTNTDIRLTGDWNGDRVDEIGVHRGNQYFQDLNGNGTFNGTTGGDHTLTFGIAGDIPLAGDWNGDSFDEIGVKRGNQFFLDVNGNGVWNGNAGGDLLLTFGNASDVPVVGDWDGDGDDQIGIYRVNQFFLDFNGNGTFNGAAGGDVLFTFGNSGDVPLAGDWDGDGDDQIGVHRGSQFFLDRNGNGAFNGSGAGGDLLHNFGAAGDVPIAGDWDADRIDEIGVHRGNTFFLDNNGNGVFNGAAGGDLQFNFGNIGDKPLDGKWRIVSSLMAAGGPATVPADSAPLTYTALAPIVQQAIVIWAKTGLSASQVTSLYSVQIGIADLAGAQLGLSTGGSILIDRDAAGYGWFVDPTPADSSEFSASGSPPGMDLLTAVVHELGHELGLDHDDDLAAMCETLAAGTRRLP